MLIKADINNDQIRANSLYINHNTECNLGKCNQNKKKPTKIKVMQPN